VAGRVGSRIPTHFDSSTHTTNGATRGCLRLTSCIGIFR